MPTEDDIIWATQIPERLKQGPVLKPLEELISYEDINGELAAVLGKEAKGNRIYPGAEAIRKLGGAYEMESGAAAAGRARPDLVDEWFETIKEKKQQGVITSFEDLIGIDGINADIVFKVFERYWKVGAEQGARLSFNLPNKNQLEGLIGPKGQQLEKRSTLRSAINFYMQLYRDLPTESRAWLASHIDIYLDHLGKDNDPPRSLRTWVESAKSLFVDPAAHRLASQYLKGSERNFRLFAHLKGIREHTGLFTATRLEAICQTLNSLPPTIENSQSDETDALINEKDQRIDDRWIVAAKATQILVQRSLKECEGLPPGDWSDLIVRLACHPSRELSGGNFDRCWHWASSDELQCGRIAFIRRDLEVVFEYLRQAAREGQKGGHMVEPRINFYTQLLHKGLILDSRLFLGAMIDRTLRRSKRFKPFWAIHNIAGGNDLCIMALKLQDGVNLTTGTKSFAMRFYPEQSKDFKRIWGSFRLGSQIPHLARDRFMHDRPICIREVHNGNWTRDVIDNILTDPLLGRVDWSHHDLV